MKSLKAIKGHTYGGMFRAVGDTYEAKDSDANLMVLVKNSVYCDAVPAAQKAAEVTVTADEKSEPKPKRPYNRKNMEAGKVGAYNTKSMTVK